MGRLGENLGRLGDIICTTYCGTFERKLLDLLVIKKVSEYNLGRSYLSNLLRNVLQQTSVEVWKCNVKESYHTESHIRVSEINV